MGPEHAHLKDINRVKYVELQTERHWPRFMIVVGLKGLYLLLKLVMHLRMRRS